MAHRTKIILELTPFLPLSAIIATIIFSGKNPYIVPNILGLLGVFMWTAHHQERAEELTSLKYFGFGILVGIGYALLPGFVLYQLTELFPNVPFLLIWALGGILLTGLATDVIRGYRIGWGWIKELI